MSNVKNIRRDKIKEIAKQEVDRYVTDLMESVDSLTDAVLHYYEYSLERDAVPDVAPERFLRRLVAGMFWIKKLEVALKTVHSNILTKGETIKLLDSIEFPKDKPKDHVICMELMSDIQNIMNSGEEHCLLCGFLYGEAMHKRKHAAEASND